MQLENGLNSQEKRSFSAIQLEFQGFNESGEFNNKQGT